MSPTGPATDIPIVGPRTTVEISQEEDLPIGLTQEMVDEVERDGEICRDDGGGGVRHGQTAEIRDVRVEEGLDALPCWSYIG